MAAIGLEAVAGSVPAGTGARARFWGTPAPGLRTAGRQALVAAGPEGVEGVIRALLAAQPVGPPPGARARRRTEGRVDGELAEGPAAGAASAAVPRAASLGPQAAEANACAPRLGSLPGPEPLQASACASAPPPPPLRRCSGLQEGASGDRSGDAPAPEAGSSPPGPCYSRSAAGPGQRDGISWVPGTGLGLGAHAVGDPASVWRHAGAVLNLGALQHDGRAPRSASAVLSTDSILSCKIIFEQ